MTRKSELDYVQWMKDADPSYEVTETLLPSEANVITYDDLIEDQDRAVATLLKETM